MRSLICSCIFLLSPLVSSGQDSVDSLFSSVPAGLEWLSPAEDSTDACGRSGCTGPCGSSGCESVPPESLLERLTVADDASLKLGGSYRIRYHNERNMRRAGLTGNDDEFVLHQTRIWVDGKLNDQVSMRAGMIDAASFGESIRPRANEVTRFDLYQLYFDVLMSEGEGTWTARLGRQEIRLGSARLLMAPAWANRRRTHDGVRLMRRGADWDIDAFWVRPAFRNVDTFTEFDSTNHNQQLYGIFSTYNGLENSSLELYWLAFDIGNPSGAGGARYDTFGSRILGEKDTWLYEFEGGFQIGRNPDDTVHSASFFTGGIGKGFKDACWSPELWFFYDYASGSGQTGNGFHSYVQRAHYYLGWMDLFGRRNLEDFNARLTFKPTETLTFVVWYHYFMLATGKDVPYNVNMRPFNGLAAGSAGSQELGHELDLALTWAPNKATQIRIGYSHFWAGRFYDTTPGVPTNSDADFLYSHFQITF